MKTKKETIFTINNRADNTYIGDVVFLPEKVISNARLGQFGSWLRKQPWFVDMVSEKEIFHFKDCMEKSDPMMFARLALLYFNREVESLQYSFNPEKERGKLFWLDLLPRDVRRGVYRNYAIGGGVEPIGIVPVFPFMGFGYIVSSEGHEWGSNSMASEAMGVFKIFRLNRVKQLAFLKNSSEFEHDRSVLTPPFHHTRYWHSLDVYAISTLLAHNCNLSPREARVLRLAGLVHDALTPAGGDSTKLIDRELFDEDVQFPRLLEGSAWEEFESAWDIDRDLLIETVLGKGILGSLLNIADKSSYLSRDTIAYLGGRVSEYKDSVFYGANFNNIANLVERYPKITAIWEVVSVIKGKVVITDADRLVNLLTLRAILFKQLYYNPFSRFFEYLLGKGVTKILYESGQISYDELLANGDEWLEAKVSDYLQCPRVLTTFHSLESSRIEEMYDLASACKRASEFDNDDDTVVIVDDFVHVSNSGTKGWFVRDRREIMTLEEARPKEVEGIERMMTFLPHKRLYFFKLSDLAVPSTSRKRVKDAFIALRKQIEKSLA